MQTFPAPPGVTIAQDGTRLAFSCFDLERLAQRGASLEVARHGVVTLDEPGIVIVLQGAFRIFRSAAFVRDVTLGLAATGDVVGAGLGERCVETGAEALCAAKLLRLPPATWEQCAAAEPELNLKLAASLAKRVLRLQKRLEQISRTGVEGRVAASVLDLAEDFGIPTPEGLYLDVPFSQNDLAQLAGTTRETCSATVAELARRELLRGNRLSGMLVLNLPGLRALAESAI